MTFNEWKENNHDELWERWKESDRKDSFSVYRWKVWDEHLKTNQE